MEFTGHISYANDAPRAHVCLLLAACTLPFGNQDVGFVYLLESYSMVS